ncbi:hypothetical protein K1X84_09105 [bacterium]|nr:hypothetical protein [bacterium]
MNNKNTGIYRRRVVYLRTIIEGFIALCLTVLFISIGPNYVFGQTKYADSTRGSIYVASIGYLSGPKKNSQSGISVGTGGQYAEIGITYFTSTIFYGEFNDQKTHGKGFSVHIEFYAKQIEQSPMTVALAASYLSMQGDNLHIPFKHIILSPSVSYQIKLGNVDLIPELSLSKMFVFEGKSNIQPSTSARLTTIAGKSVIKLLLTGEVGQTDSKSFLGVYLGVMMRSPR